MEKYTLVNKIKNAILNGERIIRNITESQQKDILLNTFKVKDGDIWKANQEQ